MVLPGPECISECIWNILSFCLVPVHFGFIFMRKWYRKMWWRKPRLHFMSATVIGLEIIIRTSREFLWKYWRFPFIPNFTHKIFAHQNFIISIEISILGKDYQNHAVLEVDFCPLWLCKLRIYTSNYGSPWIMNRTHTSDDGSSIFMDHLSFRIALDYEPLQIMDRFKRFDLTSLTFGQPGWNLHFLSPDLWLSGSYHANIFRY